MRIRSDDYIKQIAKDEGLSVETVTAIIKSQFDFVAVKMASGDKEKDIYPSIIVKGLGRFTATEGRISKVRKLKERKNGANNNVEPGVSSTPDGNSDTRVC